MPGSYSKINKVTDAQGNTHLQYDKNLYEEFGLNPYNYQAGTYNPMQNYQMQPTYNQGWEHGGVKNNSVNPYAYGQNALAMEYMSDPNKASKDMMKYLDKRWARLMGRQSGAVDREALIGGIAAGMGGPYGAGAAGSNNPYEPSPRKWGW
jgi:hypothetical protein